MGHTRLLLILGMQGLNELLTPLITEESSPFCPNVTFGMATPSLFLPGATATVSGHVDAFSSQTPNK